MSKRKVAKAKFKSCEGCGNSFQVKKGWQKFCSIKCRSAKWGADKIRVSSAELERILNSKTLYEDLERYINKLLREQRERKALVLDVSTDN